MLPYSDSRITKILFAIFFIAIAGYAYFEGRALLFGPQITVSSSTTEVHQAFVKIEGTAKRIVSLNMNGREIPVTEEGAFSEPYLLAPGNNHIMLDAKDKYGNTTSRVIEIAYIPDPNATTSATIYSASTTASSTILSATSSGSVATTSTSQSPSTTHSTASTSSTHSGQATTTPQNSVAPSEQ